MLEAVRQILNGRAKLVVDHVRVAGDGSIFQGRVPGCCLHRTIQDRANIGDMPEVEYSHQQHEKDRGDDCKFNQGSALFVAPQALW